MFLKKQNKPLFFFKTSLFFFHFTMKSSFHLFVGNEITPDKTGHLSSLYMQKPLKPSHRKKKNLNTVIANYPGRKIFPILGFSYKVRNLPVIKGIIKQFQWQS